MEDYEIKVHLNTIHSNLMSIGILLFVQTVLIALILWRVW